MEDIEFFKLQAKNLCKDYKSKHLNKDEWDYEFNPKFFKDIDEILYDWGTEDNLTLMKAQHIIAQMVGCKNWSDLIHLNKYKLQLLRLILENQYNYFVDGRQYYPPSLLEDWKMYERQNCKGFDDEAKLEIFKKVFLNKD